MAKAKASKSGSEANGVKLFRRTECPITAQEFIDHAPELDITVNGEPVRIRGTLEPRVYASGSFGWFVNGTIEIAINGKMVKFTFQPNIVAVGSKDAKRS